MIAVPGRGRIPPTWNVSTTTPWDTSSRPRARDDSFADFNPGQPTPRITSTHHPPGTYHSNCIRRLQRGTKLATDAVRLTSCNHGS
jgi:hypothetical protein